jgi:sec-independent protein translocase protein TatB
VFDMSWSELLLIAVVALIVIGPKDLPQGIKVVAQFVRKARSLAREFQSGIEEMAREAELDEVKKEIDGMSAADYAADLQQTIDPGGTVTKSLDLQAEDAGNAASSPLAAPLPSGEPAPVESELPPAETRVAEAPSETEPVAAPAAKP